MATNKMKLRHAYRSGGDDFVEETYGVRFFKDDKNLHRQIDEVLNEHEETMKALSEEDNKADEKELLEKMEYFETLDMVKKERKRRDSMKKHPSYKSEIEPYYKLQDEKTEGLSLEPSLDSFIEQLDYSINQLNDCTNEPNIIFDRCPVDFVAYAICALDQDAIDINDSEVSERFPEIKMALNHLDLI